MKYTILLTILIVMTACDDDKKTKSSLEFAEYDFKIDAFDWDSNPYKFTSYIQDSVLPERGPQRAAWDFSYVGDIKNMHKMWDSESKERKELSQEKKDSFALFEKRDAIEHILTQAKTHQVVIINEGHHMPQHRVFTAQLLDGLKEQGFNHLGLETYFASSKNDSLIQANGYPTLKSGYYTKEPQFGNLLREAHKKGFNIFGYESRGHENGKEREINQAKNIQTYMEKHPNEKLLIHCGFDHGYEGNMGNKWEKAMAGRLTEFTSINPLTISQVLYSERSKKEFENQYYQLTDLDSPSVYVNQKGHLFGEYRDSAWFDIAVFHPRSKTFNRPYWMKYGDREEVDFSFKEAKIDCPCLVFAYKKNEEIGVAVPYDIQEANEKSVKLVLDESTFNIIIWNENGKALKTEFKQ